MRKLLVIAMTAAAWLSPSPVLAQAQDFTLVNATGIAMTAISVRRFGTDQWVPLVVTPMPLGASVRGAVRFGEQDCAYDLRATLPDGRTVLWSGLNLCQAKVVSLNRSAGGELWVDYE